MLGLKRGGRPPLIAANIEDLRQAARRRVPRLFFDYMDGGAFSEATMRANTADFDRWTLEQRVMVDVTTRRQRTSFLGAEHAHPFMLAPTGFAGMLWRNGEVLAAQAAHAAGIPFCLSTVSIASLEEVRAASPGPLAFQLYMTKERDFAEALLQRAAAAGVLALFVTVDATILARREKDTRNGFFIASRPTPRAAFDMLTHPRWLLQMGLGKRPVFGNYKGRPGLPGDIVGQAHYFTQHADPSLNWADIKWVRERWRGRLIVKGILSVDDAERAIDCGADGIVVTNHGGRQLDGARSSISVLPEIVAAVGARTEVLFDSGIRRGTHILKALALGARGCLIGRAFLYGLGAAGGAGVAQAIDLLATEIDITLALMGVSDIEALRQDGARYVKKVWD
jgi:isopentenyl diphosphate isomerase/L-lactate dehydrogenase-like FMN-dependent dehydrogenase